MTGFLSEASDALVGLVVVAANFGAAAAWEGATLLVVVFAAGVSAGRLGSALIFAAATWVPRAAFAGLVAPMVRACADVASWVDFSRMARCLSSSLAKIGTRSSGIGLLSCKQRRKYGLFKTGCADGP